MQAVPLLITDLDNSRDLFVYFKDDGTIRVRALEGARIAYDQSNPELIYT